VDITNTSTTSHTFGITVGGLPQGWLILSGADCTGGSCTHPGVTLPAGGVGQVGLYISPTLETLPPPGTPYPFTVDVTATDNPALHETDSDTFTVPAIAFNQLTNHPTILYVTPDGSAAFESRITNVGNVSGTFPIVVTVPQTWTLSDFQSPISNLQPGETFTQEIGFTAVGAALGDEETIRVASPAPGTAYTQTAGVLVRVVSANAGQMYDAAQVVAELFPNDLALPIVFQNLGQQIERLELDPANLDQRDVVIHAAQAVANHSADYPLATAGEELRQIALGMADHTTPAELAADLDAMRLAVADLLAQLSALAHHGVSAAFSPGATYTLVGRPVTYTLTIANRGTLSTTYSLSIDVPDGIRNTQYASSFTIGSGEQVTVPLVVTPTEVGAFTLRADIAAQEAPIVRTQASTAPLDTLSVLHIITPELSA